MNTYKTYIYLLLITLITACSVSDNITLPEPNEDNVTDTTAIIGKLTIDVIDSSGVPISGAIIGTIPTLNPTETVTSTPSDQKERLLTLERYVTDTNGQVQLIERSFNTLQSPLIFSAYKIDTTNKIVYYGNTFVDLESSREEIIVTIQVEAKVAINQNVKIALFDPEPFPRAIDFLAREGVVFDNLIYDQYYLAGNHNWPDWSDTTTWQQVFNDANLNQYDVIIVGFDSSKYAEFDQLVAFKQNLNNFILNNDNKLLFLAQQNHASFSWDWVADFNVPQEGAGGGFITTLYETAHLENAALTATGANHLIFQGTSLTDTTDADQNQVADVWENWLHIEPNKPEIKNKVAWHAGNAETFNNYGWDILVTGPATNNYFNLPKNSGVVTAVKKFNNGSRIFFSDATYYQGSYGPRKSSSAIILKDRYLQYISQWPSLRTN